MMLARDLLVKVTFYFKEDFSLYFFEFFRASTVPVRPSQQHPAMQPSLWQESSAHVWKPCSFAAPQDLLSIACTRRPSGVCSRCLISLEVIVSSICKWNDAIFQRFHLSFFKEKGFPTGTDPKRGEEKS